MKSKPISVRKDVFRVILNKWQCLVMVKYQDPVTTEDKKQIICMYQYQWPWLTFTVKSAIENVSKFHTYENIARTIAKIWA